MEIADLQDLPLSKHNAKKRKKKQHREAALEPPLAEHRGAASILAPSSKNAEKKRKQKETAQLEPSEKPGDNGFADEGEAAVVLQVERGEGKRRKKKARQEDDKASAVNEELMPHLTKKKKKKKEDDWKHGTFSLGNSSQPSLRNAVNEAEASDHAREQASRDDAAAIPAEPAGMEIYWKLASLDSNVRESASVALVRELQAAQELYEKGGHKDRVAEELAEEVLLGSVKDDEGLQDCAPGVRYALRRLVRGVSSSRESARQGFAMALASVIGTLSCIKGEAVLKLIKKNLEVTSSMKGQEARDGLLGQLFAAGAIVRAGRLVGDASTSEQANLAKEVSELLLALAKKKSFLREPAIAVLLDLIEKMPSSSLPSSVMDGPLFQEILLTEPGNGNADALLLALRLSEKLQISLRHCQMLPKSGIMHDFFVPSHLSSVVPCLKDSSSCHPRLHSVWSVLIELIFHESSELPLQLKTEGDQSSVKKNKKRRKSDKGEAAGEERSVEGRLKSFWSIVVDMALLTSSHERKYLAMELLLLLLPRLPAAYIYAVLSNTFVRCLLDILAVKDNLLYKSAQRCLQELCQWASKDEQRLVAVVISLQRSSHGKFDNISKTDTVRSMVTHLRSKEVCFSYLHSLIDLFSQGQSKSVVGLLKVVDDFSEVEGSISKNDNVAIENGEELKEINDSSGVNIETQRLWLVDQIYNFCRQAQVEQAVRVALVKEVIKLFIPFALFNSSPNMELTVESSGEKMKWPVVPITENCRKLCLTRLQSLLVDTQHLSGPQKSMNMSSEKDENLTKNNSIEDLTVFFLHYYDLYGRSLSAIHLKPPSEEDGKTIDALWSAASKLSSALQRAPREQKEKLQAMCALISQLLLQSMKSHVNETAIELLICCKKAFGDFLNLEIEDEDENLDSPALMDVLVDILLSLLAQSSAPIRAAAEQVFRAFCDEMTEPAFLSMLRVVKKQLRAARHRSMTAISEEDSDGDELLSVEDSEDMVNENDMEDEQLKEREAEQDRLVEESDVSSEGEDGDDNQKDGSGTQPRVMMKGKGLKLMKLREKDEAANEPESDSDFDDEAMFRVDAHLAQILKQKKKAADDATKDAQTQLLHFKFRVLSLIEFCVRKKASSSLMLTALPHLLQAFVLSCSVDGNAQLADRIGSILHKKLFKAKQYPRNFNLDKAVIEGLLQRSLKLASRSKIKRVGMLAQACSFWLLKVWHGYHPHDSSGRSEIVEIFEDALEDFFVQKKSRLTSNFFREAFVRYPWLGRSCLKKLLNKCMSSRSEYLQYEAIVLVGSILRPKTNKETSENAQDDDSERQSFKPHLSVLIEVLVLLLQKPASKTARRSEARRFCMSTLKFLSQQYPDTLLKELIGDSAYNSCVTLLGTSTFATLLKASTNPAAGNISKSHHMNDRNNPLEEARLTKKQKKVGSRRG